MSTAIQDFPVRHPNPPPISITAVRSLSPSRSLIHPERSPRCSSRFPNPSTPSYGCPARSVTKSSSTSTVQSHSPIPNNVVKSGLVEQTNPHSNKTYLVGCFAGRMGKRTWECQVPREPSVKPGAVRPPQVQNWCPTPDPRLSKHWTGDLW